MKHGFTLIELSIVLVIIGLIVGGIVGGQQLVYASKLRAQGKQFAEIDTAINLFKTKYNCKPGDCLTATRFFTSPPTIVNGDGNGQIAMSWYFWPTYNYEVEFFQIWLHLEKAELIKGPQFYRGFNYDGNNYSFRPGVNIPRMKISENSGIMMGVGSTSYTFDFRPDQNIYLTYGYGTFYPFIPSQAMELDQKIDDGRPGTGNLRMFTHYSVATCATSTTQITAFYDVTQTTPQCILAMRSSF